MKRLDVVIILIIVVISVSSLGIYKMMTNKSYENKYIEISIDGKPFKTIELDNPSYKEEFTIKTELGTNIVKIENGEADIIDADCPDKLCVKDGSISKPGEILVCLPNKLVVEIKGQRNATIDQLSY